MLKRLYDKSRIWFAVLWIAAYCVLMSVGDELSRLVGVEKCFTLGVGLTLSVLLLMFLKKYGLLKNYGLSLPKTRGSEMLYYAPLVLMMGVNLIFGISISRRAPDAVFYVLSMLCVGFLEELIFRGLLFEAMRKDSYKAAVIVSSLTFGFGHIINLLNGSGADLGSNLLQVLYATVAGFMFVLVYLRSQSLLPCILAHGVFNALSVFTPERQSLMGSIVSSALLVIITGLYALYLALMNKRTVTKK